MTPEPIRAGSRVRYKRPGAIERYFRLKGIFGTVAWVDRTQPHRTFVHVLWDGGGASKVNILNVEHAGGTEA